MSVPADRHTVESLVWGHPDRGLRLGIGAQDGAVELRLENVGDTSLGVLSHVQGEERHFDWFTLVVRNPDGGVRELRLMDERDKSAPVRVRLAPGSSLRHEVNPDAWARRSVNGARPLPEGKLDISVRYEVPADRTAWTGRLVAGPVSGEFVVPVRTR